MHKRIYKKLDKQKYVKRMMAYVMKSYYSRVGEGGGGAKKMFSKTLNIIVFFNEKYMDAVLRNSRGKALSLMFHTYNYSLYKKYVNVRIYCNTVIILILHKWSFVS